MRRPPPTPPDREHEAGPRPHRLPRPFVGTIHDVLPSTSDTAKALAAGGAAHGTTVCALRQTAGRGRLGRSWTSPPGNLHASFVLRYDVAPARQAELGFAAALAAADLVDHHLAGGAGARLKWPNDVLVGEAKIAGILLEADAAQAAPWLVLGIGVNLRHVPPDLPYAAASVASLGAVPPEPEAALHQLAAALGTWLAVWESEGFAPLRAAWLRRGPAPGTPLRITRGDTTRHGEFLDLAADGALMLWTPDGTLRITTGMVS
ncbi:MAG: biotin--[acetyl-CoA-carboxylase] ligase [Rhodospirillales bacterium]|nr:biotin--[acetyl-CoA-carboxylase] ligase [Rhodospirillales bacterium]